VLNLYYVISVYSVYGEINMVMITDDDDDDDDDDDVEAQFSAKRDSSFKTARCCVH